MKKIFDFIDRKIASKFGKIADKLEYLGMIKKYGLIYIFLWKIDNFFNDLNTKIHSNR